MPRNRPADQLIGPLQVKNMFVTRIYQPPGIGSISAKMTGGLNDDRQPRYFKFEAKTLGDVRRFLLSGEYVYVYTKAHSKGFDRLVSTDRVWGLKPAPEPVRPASIDDGFFVLA